VNRQRLKAVLPWVVALALVGYLFYSIPLDRLRLALAETNLLGIMAVALFVDLAALMTDSWATSRVFSWFLAPVSFRELIPVRAATYLMAILNYNLGQAGLLYYVYRVKRVPLLQTTAVTLMQMGSVILLLSLMALVGLWLAPDERTRQFSLLLIALGGGALVYFAVLKLRPGWLYRRALLRPLFDAGVLGHLLASATRIPHIGVIVCTHIVAMRLFDIWIPLGSGLVLIPLVLLVAAIPLTPFGLGTQQWTAIQLFSPYARGADPASRQALVLAYSLSLATLALVFQALLGLVFLKRVADLIKKPTELAAGGEPTSARVPQEPEDRRAPPPDRRQRPSK
jgi:hypothetical protein